MLKISRRALGGHGHGEKGLPLKVIYPKVGNWSGSPHPNGKRTSPFREGLKHPGLAKGPNGWFITKHVVGWPLHPPFEYHFYRTPCTVFVLCAGYDLLYGFPVPFYKERVPGNPTHFFFHNNGGMPHHFWCYQDGWYMPNPSGVKRMRE